MQVLDKNLSVREKFQQLKNAWTNPQTVATLPPNMLHALVTIVIAAAERHALNSSNVKFDISDHESDNASAEADNSTVASLIHVLRSSKSPVDPAAASAILAHVANHESDKLALVWLNWIVDSASKDEKTDNEASEILKKPETYAMLIKACTSTSKSGQSTFQAPSVRAGAVSAIWAEALSRNVVVDIGPTVNVLRLLRSYFKNNIANDSTSQSSTALDTAVSILKSSIVNHKADSPFDKHSWLLWQLCINGRGSEAKDMIDLAIKNDAPVLDEHIKAVVRGLLSSKNSMDAFEFFVRATHDGLIAPSETLFQYLIHHFAVKDTRLDIVGRLYADMHILGIHLSEKMQRDIISACWTASDVQTLAKFTQDSQKFTPSDLTDSTEKFISSSTTKWVTALLDLCIAGGDVDVIVRFSSMISKLASRGDLSHTLMEKVAKSLLRLDRLDLAFPIIEDMCSIAERVSILSAENTSSSTPALASDNATTNDETASESAEPANKLLSHELSIDLVSALTSPARNVANQSDIFNDFIDRLLMRYKGKLMSAHLLSRLVVRALEVHTQTTSHSSIMSVCESMFVQSIHDTVSNHTSYASQWPLFSIDMYAQIIDRFVTLSREDLALRVFEIAAMHRLSMDNTMLDQWQKLAVSAIGKTIRLKGKYAREKSISDHAVLMLVARLVSAQLEVLELVLRQAELAANRVFPAPSGRVSSNNAIDDASHDIRSWQNVLRHRSAIMHWIFSHHPVNPHAWYTIGIRYILNNMSTKTNESCLFVAQYYRRLQAHAINKSSLSVTFFDKMQHQMNRLDRIVARESEYLNNMVNRLDTLKGSKLIAHLDVCDRVMRRSKTSLGMTSHSRVALLRHAYQHGRFVLAVHACEKLDLRIMFGHERVLEMFLDACIKSGNESVAIQMLRNAITDTEQIPRITMAISNLLDIPASTKESGKTIDQTRLDAIVVLGTAEIVRHIRMRLNSGRLSQASAKNADSSFCRALANISAGPIQEILFGNDVSNIVRLGGRAYTALLWMIGIPKQDMCLHDRTFVIEQVMRCIDEAQPTASDAGDTHNHDKNQHKYLVSDTDKVANAIKILAKCAIMCPGARHPDEAQHLSRIASMLAQNDDYHASLIHLCQTLFLCTLDNDDIIASVIPHLTDLLSRRCYADASNGVDHRILMLLNDARRARTCLVRDSVDAGRAIEAFIDAVETTQQEMLDEQKSRLRTVITEP